MVIAHIKEKTKVKAIGGDEYTINGHTVHHIHFKNWDDREAATRRIERTSQIFDEYNYRIYDFQEDFRTCKFVNSYEPI